MDQQLGNRQALAHNTLASGIRRRLRRPTTSPTAPTTQATPAQARTPHHRRLVQPEQARRRRRLQLLKLTE